MDVKEVNKGSTTKSVETNSQKSQQRALASLSAEKIETATRSDAVSVNVEPRQKTGVSQESRKKANSFINVVNNVEDATNELSRLVESLDGIVEQAATNEISDARSAALEKEANDIVDAIRKKSFSDVFDGSRPLQGDPIKIEAEEELGKTLEVLFKDNGDDAFGIQSIALSPPENILRTRANIDEARQRLEGLRQAVDTAKGEARQFVDTIDVALQNAEASESQVRDIDEALKLTKNLGSQIGLDPERAQSASAGIKKDALELLE